MVGPILTRPYMELDFITSPSQLHAFCRARTCWCSGRKEWGLLFCCVGLCGCPPLIWSPPSFAGVPHSLKISPIFYPNSRWGCAYVESPYSAIHRSPMAVLTQSTWYSSTFLLGIFRNFRCLHTTGEPRFFEVATFLILPVFILWLPIQVLH